MLPPVKEVKVIPLSALSQGYSDEGLLFLEGDTVVSLADEIYPLFWEAVRLLEQTCCLKVVVSTSIRARSAGKRWPEVGRIILAHWPASGPDPFGQNLTQAARTKSDPGWFCTVLFRTSVEEKNQV